MSGSRGLHFIDSAPFWLTHNVKALAMWPEFMAKSAWLPMPDKGIMFSLNYADH
jgi:hypothetical protein